MNIGINILMPRPVMNLVTCFCLLARFPFGFLLCVFAWAFSSCTQLQHVIKRTLVKLVVVKPNMSYNDRPHALKVALCDLVSQLHHDTHFARQHGLLWRGQILGSTLLHSLEGSQRAV